ncbi:hypothetical protein BCY84_01519 [Trypanosoma cruzi cruzi]|uniref:Uncharacterized protein n=1 Tax=Trypanosoma cruzi TaxID=5693 RepID=A0A2V2VHT1_TRYCR|nr:hypothetical protein BCY84_01519 [Trypanosoma cruzi cruzi]PWU95995.1 hypothetical protein C4B63_20g190 [Trypanosoma cruzi]
MDSRKGAAGDSLTGSNTNGSSVGRAPTPTAQQPRLHDTAAAERCGDEGSDNEPEQPLFYQVNMREITNALLVPADMVSAKLRPLTPSTVAEGPTIQVTSGVLADGGTDYSSNASSNSGRFLDVPPANLPVRHGRHHSTVRAAVLPSPENTFYVEDTLVIGSVGRRGGLVERGNTFSNECQRQGDATTPARPIASSSLLPVPRPPGFAARSSSPPLSKPFNDALQSSSLRSVTFLVQKPTRIERCVDTISEESVGLEQPLIAEGVNVTKKSASKKKRVHFPEDVIKSVSVVHADDQLRLLVEYYRPWYAHLVLLVASAFFVFHWGFVVLAMRPSEVSQRFAASVVISFVAFGFASAYLLAFLALTWRPGSEELGFLMDFSRNRPVIYVLLAGVASQLSLVASFMFRCDVGSLVCFCCIPLVVTYLYEEYKKHAVSVLDCIGCILVVGSIVVFYVGAEIDDDSKLYYRVVPVCISVVGGVSMAYFLFQVRTVSRCVSNFFIMSSTTTLVTLLLAFVGYVMDAFASPIGASQKKLTEISSEDFFKIIVSALFLFFAWFTYHWSSLFFDRMTLSGSFSLGGPISLLVFNLLSLPTASLPYEIAGGVAMMIGCALVLFSGFRFRQNVEVRIELERE